MRKLDGYLLWIGHVGDLRNVREILTAGIEAIVEVADSEELAELPRDRIRMRFPLADGGENPSWLLRLAADTVASLLRADVPTIVACSAGLSRSVCVAAAAIAIVQQLSFHQAVLRVVANGPADVSPQLAQQFQFMDASAV